MSEIQSVIFNKHIWTKKEAIKFLKKNNLKNIKPVHETVNFYRYRIRKPEKFKYFRLKKIPIGIEMVIGFFH